MTPREYLLARVLGEPRCRGEVIVLKGPRAETSQRVYRAEGIAHEITLAKGTNTWEEALHTINTGRKHLTVVTSAYHQLRAFLTFVKAAEGRDVWIWNYTTPSLMDDLATEFAKITDYQQRGHVATYEQGLEYLQWRDAA